MENKLTLENALSETIKLRREIRLLRQDLRNMKEESPKFQEIQKLRDKVKVLKNKFSYDDAEIDELADKIKTLNERKELVGAILKELMLEEQPHLPGIKQISVEHEGYKFILEDKLKIKKGE